MVNIGYRSDCQTLDHQVAIRYDVTVDTCTKRFFVSPSRASSCQQHHHSTRYVSLRCNAFGSTGSRILLLTFRKATELMDQNLPPRGLKQTKHQEKDTIGQHRHQQRPTNHRQPHLEPFQRHHQRFNNFSNTTSLSQGPNQ